MTTDIPGGVWDLEAARKHVESCPHCHPIMRGGTIGDFRRGLAQMLGAENEDKPEEH